MSKAVNEGSRASRNESAYKRQNGESDPYPLERKEVRKRGTSPRQRGHAHLVFGIISEPSGGGGEVSSVARNHRKKKAAEV